MDQYFTEEDPVIKARKPYTITKQRERWTDEEHSRFLEALKLYGRAWQRIEEHIGTKTAVQIRSHAQKFFTKLEKDALVKGVPIVQALDIDIPPPRPKRKPSNPYPRKTIAGSLISQVVIRDERPSQSKQLIMVLEKEQHHEKATDEEQTKNALEVGNLLQEACSSISSINKSFFPSVTSKKEVISQVSESHISSESRTMVPKYGDVKQLFQDDDIGKASEFQNSKASLEQLHKCESHFLPTNEMHSTVNNLGGSLEISAQTSLPEIHFQDPKFNTKEGVQGRNNLCANAAASSPSENQNSHQRSISQSFPDFQTPCTPPICHNQDYYKSFLYTSSTFSNLISSTLWPYKNAETSAESSVCNQEGFSLMQLNSSPGIAAIAAATVAAATAWWAAHGPLAPFHAAFTCPPAVGNAVPDTMAEGRVELSQRCPSQDLQVNPEQSEVLQAESSASKSCLLTEPKEIQDTKVHDLKECHDHEKGHDDWNTEKRRKRIYHSSLCSNTTSNGKVEIDAIEKNKKGEEDQEELEANAAATESGSRRSKCTSNSNDSWKEVSQQRRLAFQALFSRGVLPQSFSPQQDPKDENQETNKNKKHIDSANDDLHLSLTLKGGSCRNDQSSETITIGLGPGKISHRRTGFKPYIRCSVESTENRVGASNCFGEEKGAKRIRLEKASS